MAAPNSWTLDIDSSVAAPRLFFAAVMDWHTLAPKLTPQIVASGHVVVGDGHASSVRELHFTKEMPFSCMKERLDFVDVKTFESRSTLIEGAGIGIWIESATTEIKVEPKGDGCAVNVKWACKLMPGVKVNEDQLNSAKDSLTGIFKTAEEYLIANPEAYSKPI
ncbi:pathogenesis-related protein 1-like [Lolium rigidum]|uniref:pathogenesis-related protein 1-like n=1 Tax=Lolium rigidum TaxID=89674 RepID=UPI001F5CF60A|nr:pathogenesis-related protein 1-like [Lolium rigidum]